MTNGIDNLLLGVHYHLYNFFFMKYLFKSFAYFLNWVVSFLLLSCTSSLCYRYKFRIRNIICKIFLPFCGLSLEAPPFLILMRFIFFFPLVCVLVPYLRNPQSRRFRYVFYSKSFIFLALIFRSLIYLS